MKLTKATHKEPSSTAAPTQQYKSSASVMDTRPAASAQLHRQQLSDQSQQSAQLKQHLGKLDTDQHAAIQRMVEEEPTQKKSAPLQRIEEEEPAQRAPLEEESIQGKADTMQPVEDEEPIQGKFDTAQRIEEEEPAQKKANEAVNNTGLPNQLKAGIESLSGMSMDHVKVHTNSDKPAQLNAHAFAQGSDIHVAPGQEQHLPHEAWHVVQQAQGRVKPTKQMKMGVPVNDDVGLETEADVMGAKAMGVGEVAQGKSNSYDAPVNVNAPTQPLAQAKKDGKVMQLLATVNPNTGPVNLAQTGGGAGAFVVMHDPLEPVGNDPDNTIGFTGLLNEDQWGDLGISPRNFWRAHAYAKSFGGAGSGANVGWWTEASEATWTAHEQKVRGADGAAQIAEWLPGVGETGTYNVAREMHPAVDLSGKYAADLQRGVAWGMDSTRAAWTRAIATCDAIQPQKARETRIAALKVGRDWGALAARGRVDAWAAKGFGTTPLNPNLVKKMTMAYTVTAAGAGAGPSRAAYGASVASALPNRAQFGLKNQPQQIWEYLVSHNVGIFSKGTAPAPLMARQVAYPDPQKPHQQLRAVADGWGVA